MPASLEISISGQTPGVRDGNEHNQLQRTMRDKGSSDVTEVSIIRRLRAVQRILERVRERSRLAHMHALQLNSAAVAPESAPSTCEPAILGRSSITMPSCFPTLSSAAACPKTLVLRTVVMDIESDEDLISSSVKASLGPLAPSSAMPLSPSLASPSFSSSSAQSSPFCLTPESPPVSLPPLAGDSPRINASARLCEKYATFPLQRTMPDTQGCIHHDDKSADMKSLATTASSSSPSPSLCDEAEPNSPPNNARRCSYLSRSQRRLARAVTDSTDHEVHRYIYQGGQTGVVSGRVMLGPKSGSEQAARKQTRKGQKHGKRKTWSKYKHPHEADAHHEGSKAAVEGR